MLHVALAVFRELNECTDTLTEGYCNIVRGLWEQQSDEYMYTCLIPCIQLMRHGTCKIVLPMQKQVCKTPDCPWQ